MSSVKMIARRSLTAHQSPTGKPMMPGDGYEVETDDIARLHAARGLGDRAPVAKEKPKPAPKAEA